MMWTERLKVESAPKWATLHRVRQMNRETKNQSIRPDDVDCSILYAFRFVFLFYFSFSWLAFGSVGRWSIDAVAFVRT